MRFASKVRAILETSAVPLARQKVLKNQGVANRSFELLLLGEASREMRASGFTPLRPPYEEDAS
jgi:hypothetical protein